MKWILKFWNISQNFQFFIDPLIPQKFVSSWKDFENPIVLKVKTLNPKENSSFLTNGGKENAAAWICNPRIILVVNTSDMEFLNYIFQNY